MLKLTGIFLIVTFSSVLGMVFSRDEKRKRAVFEELVRLTEYVSKEITRRRHLNDIIRDGTLKNTHIRASDRKELDALLTSLCYKGSAGELLMRFESFFGTLGCGASAESEHKACESFLEAVKPSYDMFCDESTKHSGLYLKLGTIFGFAVCILVI